jgi:prefoldin subunit 5
VTTEERVTKLEEAVLVNSALLNRLEQGGEDHKEWLGAHNAAIKKHDEEIADLRHALQALSGAERRTNEAVEKLSGVVEKLSADVLVMNSAVNGLFQRMDRLNERIDRFIQGQEGNGRKQ